jgi:hypothetical protein
MVLQDGIRIARHIRYFYNAKPRAAMLDCLRVIAGLNLGDRFQRDFMHILYAEFGNEFFPHDCYSNCVKYSFSSLAHVARLAIAEGRLSQWDGQQEAARIVHWICAEYIEIDRPCRQLGWDFMVRKSESYAQLQWNRKAVSSLEWPTPFDVLHFGEWRVEAMKSAGQLFDEGHAMRNCIVNLAPDCAAQTVLVVSVVHVSGKRVAHATFHWIEEQWELDAALGPANRALSHDVDRRIRTLSKHLPPPLPTQKLDQDGDLPDALRSRLPSAS